MSLRDDLKRMTEVALAGSPEVDGAFLNQVHLMEDQAKRGKTCCRLQLQGRSLTHEERQELFTRLRDQEIEVIVLPGLAGDDQREGPWVELKW